MLLSGCNKRACTRSISFFTGFSNGIYHKRIVFALCRKKYQKIRKIKNIHIDKQKKKYKIELIQ